MRLRVSHLKWAVRVIFTFGILMPFLVPIGKAVLVWIATWIAYTVFNLKVPMRRDADYVIFGGNKTKLKPGSMRPAAPSVPAMNSADEARFYQLAQKTPQEQFDATIREDLTGFYNALDGEISCASTQGYSFSLEAIDFNHLPEFSQYPTLLFAVAGKIHSGCGPTDSVFRTDDSEFVILRRQCSKMDACEIVRLQRQMLVGALSGGWPEITVCIGVVGWPEDGRTKSELLENLHKASQLAKSSKHGGIAAAKAGMLLLAPEL